MFRINIGFTDEFIAIKKKNKHTLPLEKKGKKKISFLAQYVSEEKFE